MLSCNKMIPTWIKYNMQLIWFIYTEGLKLISQEESFKSHFNVPLSDPFSFLAYIELLFAWLAFYLFLFLGKKAKEKRSPAYVCVTLKSLWEASKRVYLRDRSHAIIHMVLNKGRARKVDKRRQRCRKKKEGEIQSNLIWHLKKNTPRALSVLESSIDAESPIPGKETQSPDTCKPWHLFIFKQYALETEDQHYHRCSLRECPAVGNSYT